jgi:tetratricopeptide (TPR) repeat protein
MATMPPDQIVEIARHFTKAAPIVGPSVAIPYLIAAADDARARTAFQQAEQSLRTALDLAAQLHEVGERLAVKRQIERRLNLLLLMVPAASPLLDEADETPEAVELRLPLDDESTAEWFATMLYSITSGKNERVLSTAQAALQHDLPNRGAAAAQFMVGAAAFVLGDHDLAEKGFAQTEGLIDTFSASIVPGTFSLRAATFTIRAPMAVIDGDVATADRCLEQARNMAGSSLTDLVSVEYFTAWCAACLGDAARAVRYADACVEVAAKLGEALYGPMASLISGWAAAMQGDPNGLGTASRAHEQYAAAGLKFLDTVQLVLLAEAHAHHGEQNHARELVQQARELASVTGEHTFSPRLAALADRLVAVPT